jgi:hypothetical protein
MKFTIGLDIGLALVDGAPGWVSEREGVPYAVAAVTVRKGRNASIDILFGPGRLLGP